MASISGYKVQCRTLPDGSSSAETNKPLSQLSHEYTGLTLDQSYKIRVRSYHSNEHPNNNYRWDYATVYADDCAVSGSSTCSIAGQFGWSFCEQLHASEPTAMPAREHRAVIYTPTTPNAPATSHRSQDPVRFFPKWPNGKTPSTTVAKFPDAQTALRRSALAWLGHVRKPFIRVAIQEDERTDLHSGGRAPGGGRTSESRWWTCGAAHMLSG